MITKDILLTLTYLVGAGELALAVFFWVTHSKSEIRKVMALLSFSIAGWVITNAVFSNSGTHIVALTYVFGILLLTALFHLVLIYPYRFYNIDRLHIISLYVPWLFFSYALLFTNTIIPYYPIVNNASKLIPGPLYPVLALFMIIAYVGSLAILLVRLPRLDGLHRRNTSWFMWSVIIAGIPGIIIAILHVFDNLPFNYLYGPIFSIVWLAGITYTIKRK